MTRAQRREQERKEQHELAQRRLNVKSAIELFELANSLRGADPAAADKAEEQARYHMQVVSLPASLTAWEEWREHLKCTCQASDAWKCARIDRRPIVACGCTCHRYIYGRPEPPR